MRPRRLWLAALGPMLGGCLDGCRSLSNEALEWDVEEWLIEECAEQDWEPKPEEIEDCDTGLELGECSSGDGLLYPLEEGAWWRHDVYSEDGGLECKLVWVEEERAIDLRPEKRAFAVHSLRVRPSGPHEYGIRWQSKDGCSLYREVDEWFGRYEGERTYIEFYCPNRSRVQDCEGACEGNAPNPDECDEVCSGATWMAEPYDSVVITPVSGWDACLSTLETRDACDLVGEVGGCGAEKDGGGTDTAWCVQEAHYDVAVQAGSFETLWTQQRSTESGSSTAWHSYWRARGVGKVQEYEPGNEWEYLIRYCVPSTGGDCDNPPPW